MEGCGGAVEYGTIFSQHKAQVVVVDSFTFLNSEHTRIIYELQTKKEKFAYSSMNILYVSLNFFLPFCSLRATFSSITVLQNLGYTNTRSDLIFFFCHGRVEGAAEEIAQYISTLPLSKAYAHVKKYNIRHMLLCQSFVCWILQTAIPTHITDC